MFIIKFDLLLLITMFHVCHCERRIIQGEQVTSEKTYVVYLIKATISDRTYDSWLCGGALVSKDFIITSAACVEDVHYMYAIAGYRKYVNEKNLELNDCTKQMKKKIVYTCVPVSYEFDFDKIEKWAYIDIALAKVESPYDLSDARFQLICSYVPSVIPINYDLKRQATNVDAMVLGWGHTQSWRQHGDHVNYNQEYLRYGSTMLYDKKKCQQEYKDYVDLTKIIDKYMICSMEPGHVNDHGVPYSMKAKPKLARTGCITQKQKALGMQGILCKEGHISEQPEQILMDHLVHDRDETRKRMNVNEKSINITDINVNGTVFVKGTDILNGTSIVNGTDTVNGTDIINGTGIAIGTGIVNGTDIPEGADNTKGNDFIYKPAFGKISGYYNRSFTRRNGICQNDHGGPLVTWAGKREILIGVASVFKITEQNQCVGPFLYTSTVCNGAFLGCLLGDRRANVLRGMDMSVSTSKALLCDSPPSVRGFDMIESYVSWKDHPAGPADNERHMRGVLVPNVKRDRYATKVTNDSEEDTNPLNDLNSQQKIHPNMRPKKVESEENDRFSSLRISIPAGGLRPRKRHRIRKRPLPKRSSTTTVGSPQETEPLPLNSPPQEMAPPLNSGPPPEMAPPLLSRLSPEIAPPLISRPSPEMAPPLISRPLPEMAPPPMTRPPPEMAPPPIGRPPLVMVHLPVAPSARAPSKLGFLPTRPQPKMRPPPNVRLPPQMEPPAFDDILNFKSDEVFLKKTFHRKPNPEFNEPSPVAQAEIQIRPQSPLRG